MRQTFDAIVIGSGQAGVPLTRALAESGWNVAVIENNLVGGSCVNYGCTPTKALVASARRAWVARNSIDHGIHAFDLTLDFPKIMARKDAIVAGFREGIEQRRFKHENITLFRETGRFVDTHKIQLESEVIEGKKIFINTGQSPIIPNIPGLEAVPYLTSTTILDLKVLPEHLIIIGGGYIGLEFGQMFKRFGSRVTIIQKGDRLARTEDPDISEEIRKVLEGEGITVLLESEVVSVNQTESTIHISLFRKDKTETVTGSHLLIATGRKSNTEELDLGNAGVVTDAKGNIVVNEKLETNVPNIWALGDVTGGPAFTHVSYNDYEVVYRNMVLGEKASTHDRVLVYAMFIDPSLGRVGLTETQAREQGFDLAVAEYPTAWVARAIELGETQGKLKLVVDKKTEKILGASVLAYEGAELVHYLAAYMNAHASLRTLQRAITIHPTLSEGLQSLALKLHI
ncbi:MAG TPA: mercuric reductase [Patescibacteria group bacterium]|nr:mercuric reductase [Patescibacteria group bacterium]